MTKTLRHALGAALLLNKDELVDLARTVLREVKKHDDENAELWKKTHDGFCLACGGRPPCYCTRDE